MAFEDAEGAYSGDLDIFPSHDEMFLFNSQKLSKKHEQSEAEAGERLNREPWAPERNLDLLVLSPGNQYIHAEAKPGYGIIGLRENIMARWQEPIPQAVLLHERTHIQTGSEIRKGMAETFPEIDDFFHRRLIPDWKAGKISLRYDRPYCDDKEWRGLLMSGGMDDTLEEYQNGLTAYMTALRKGQIRVRGGGIISVPSPRFSSFQRETVEAPDQPLEARYESDPEGTMVQIVTGFEIADEFQTRYRDGLARHYRISLFDLEEGFANFVGCTLSGVGIEKMNQYFPQDEGKVRLAQTVIAKAAERGIAATDALSRVHSQTELISFFTELGII